MKIAKNQLNFWAMEINKVESELEIRKSEAIHEHQLEEQKKVAPVAPVAEKIVVKDDGMGSQIYAQGKGIYLFIKGAPKARRICTIDLERKMMHVNREEYESYKRYYAFEFEMLSVAKKCDTLRIVCPEGTFDVPIAQILLYGKKLNGNAGIQTQIYYRISDMKLYPAKN